MQAGSFAASCPELGLFCQADTEEEAVNRIQSLIAFQLTRSEVDHPADFISTANMKQGKHQGRNGGCRTTVLYMPHRTHVQ